MDAPPSPLAVTVPSVAFPEAVRVWLRIGLLSFGGPAGQISLNYCMLLPGPEAQLAR
jgi:chromate transporter